jgi:hypothetical protein
MEVEYELTLDDLYAFQWRAAYSSAIARRARYKVYACSFLALILFSLLSSFGTGGFVISRVNLYFLVVACPAVLLAYFFLERRMTRRLILQLLKKEKPDKGQLGRHKVVLSEGEVVESTAVGESRTSWAGVDRIEQNPDYIFLYTSPAGAHIIPKRAFRDRQEAEGFYQLSRISKEAAA